MDSGLINAILFIDLKKAFDTIDQNILLQKLNCYGFNKKRLIFLETIFLIVLK